MKMTSNAPAFSEVQYARIETADDEPYQLFYDDCADAVEEGGGTDVYVATYKLVKVERLTIKRSVKLVKAK